MGAFFSFSGVFSVVDIKKRPVYGAFCGFSDNQFSLELALALNITQAAIKIRAKSIGKKVYFNKEKLLKIISEKNFQN